MSRRQRVCVHLACNCPRREKLFQADILDLPRHIGSSANMVHQILWHALPDGTPRHWVPPQLSQFQVAACQMPIHIAPDQGATKRTRRRLFLSIFHFRRLAHLLPTPVVATAYMVNHRRRPFVYQIRQPRHGDMGLRQITHVHNSHIMKVLVQTPAVRNKHSNAKGVSPLKNTTLYRADQPFRKHPERFAAAQH